MNDYAKLRQLLIFGLEEHPRLTSNQKINLKFKIISNPLFKIRSAILPPL